ncbi:type IV secretory system Conjugative DNA transfer [Yoonia vestfoldensis]|uniref:Type IV secretory system Conjugative DNA transfer n=2 Tax=Yoonia vestfoldensis TaxID=245188 RepID=A0A1Y0E6X2_9RHOB|nr:type IV secretory system Conjugative DNA transfer [Yoonia vestfoldensis]
MITRQAVLWSIGIAICGFLMSYGLHYFVGNNLLLRILQNSVTPAEMVRFSMTYIYLFVVMAVAFYYLSRSKSILCLGPLLMSASAAFFASGYYLMLYFALVLREEFNFQNGFNLRADFLPSAMVFAVWFLVGALGFKMTMALPSRLALAKDNQRKTREDYRSKSTVFGDARLGKWSHIKERIAPIGDGIVLGEDYDPRNNPDYDHADKETWGKGGKSDLIQMKTGYEGGHTLIVGGTGAAKTAAYVIPTCMKYPHSLVVVDPGGSALRQCYDKRVAMGRDIREVSPEHGLDVMAMMKHCLKTSRDFRHLADMMIVREKDSEFSKFYAEESITVLAALLEYFTNEMPTVGVFEGVAQVVHLPESKMKAMLVDIVGASANPTISAALLGLIEKDSKFFTYFSSTLQQSLKWTMYPDMIQMVSVDSPDAPPALGDQTDLFITLRMDDFKQFPGLVRLILGSVTYDMKLRETRAKEKLMIVDEAPLLGYFPLFEDIRDRARQFRLHLMIVFQNIGQIEEAYGRSGPKSWNDVASRAYSAIGDLGEAEALSRMIGTFTVDVAENTQGASGATLATVAQSSNMSLSERTQQAALVTPDEIMQLPADAQILLFRRQPPLICGKALYFRRNAWVKADDDEGRSGSFVAQLAGRFSKQRSFRKSRV